MNLDRVGVGHEHSDHSPDYYYYESEVKKISYRLWTNKYGLEDGGVEWKEQHLCWRAHDQCFMASFLNMNGLIKECQMLK